MSKIGKYVGIAVVSVGILGAGFLAVAPAAAQTDDPAPPDGGPAGHFGPRGRAGFGDNEEKEAALADALGVSVDELQAAVEAASSPGDVADALGISQEDFQAAMQDARAAAIQQAVEDGAITQEQADQLLEGGFGPRGGGGRGNGLRPFGRSTGS